MKNFNDLQKKYRKKSGLSMQALAVRVKLSNAIIADYELGKNFPSFKKALLISRELNFDLDKLLKKRYQKNSRNKIGLAANIRYKRKEKGISQEYLAKKLQTTRSIISKYENGRHVPNILMVIKMAKFFKCSLYDFA